TSRGDLLVVDRLAHNSVHAGAKLAAAEGTTVAELSPCEPEMLSRILKRRRKARGRLVAVDGVYSMLGSVPPLTELDQVARQHGGVLYIDDAHGTGVIGRKGRGAAFAALGRLDNVMVAGSLSKAFSCMGGFVTCTPELKLLLKMKSDTYLFGGPVPPPYLEAVCVVCDILMSPEYERLVGRLRELVRRFAHGARELGYHVLGDQSPIVSIL